MLRLSKLVKATASEAKGLHSGQVNTGLGTSSGGAPAVGQVPCSAGGFTCEWRACWEGKGILTFPQGGGIYSGQDWMLRDRRPNPLLSTTVHVYWLYECFDW